jgi:hypothetical protein
MKHRQRTARRPTPSRNGTHHANGHRKATPSPSPTGANGAAPANHAVNGRFIAGNKAAVGNPHARRVARLKGQLLNVAETRLPRVVQAMYDKAEQGDVQAAELIFKYSLGRPSPGLDVDRVTSGLDELRLLLAAPLDAELMLAGANGVSVAEAVAFLRGVAAAKAKKPLAFLDDADDADGEDGEGGKLPVVHRLRERVLASRAAKG